LSHPSVLERVILTIPGMGEEEVRRMVEGVNLSTIYLIYCKKELL
jgi:hypothetical protein